VGEVIQLFLAVLLLAMPPRPVFATQSDYRVVNVTLGSEPGWIPSIQLEQEARSVASQYLRALDEGKYDYARSLQGDGLKAIWPENRFRTDSKQSKKKNGALLTLNIRAINWTKDSASAPSPGLYVAIDLENKYTLASRHCGFIILFKRTQSDSFKVVRSENTYMNDKTAKSFGADAPNVWRRVSAVCPGYAPPP
jgi:hypothetical protein